MAYGVERVVGALPVGGKAYWPAVLRRTALEHSRLREFINRYAPTEKPHLAVELGCGYGRMLPLLHEFADAVTGIERDDELRGIAALVSESAETIRGTESLTKVPVESGSANIVLTYTVLQHLNDSECAQALSEVRRILKSGGLFVGVEDNAGGGTASADYFPRSLETYRKMVGLKFLGTHPRIVERDQVVGQMMAFVA